MTQYVPKCPICREPTVERFRPFCCKRCADIDLSRWLGGRYAVAGHADAEEDSDSQNAAEAAARGTPAVERGDRDED